MVNVEGGRTVDCGAAQISFNKSLLDNCAQLVIYLLSCPRPRITRHIMPGIKLIGMPKKTSLSNCVSTLAAETREDSGGKLA